MENTPPAVEDMQNHHWRVACGACLFLLCYALSNSALAFEESSKFSTRKKVSFDATAPVSRNKVSFDAAPINSNRSKSAFDGSPMYSAKNKREAFSKSCEYDHRGVALEEQGKPAEAIEQFKLAIATYPFYWVHYCNYGNALADLKRYPEAIEQYKKAVKLSPDSAAAYCNMADAMLKNKDYIGAELACKSAIRVDPGYVPAMTNLAEVYINTNKPNEAITVLKSAGGLSSTFGMKKIIAEDLQAAKEMLETSTD
jgi:tetratricopeptide (TPR) repeat protein